MKINKFLIFIFSLIIFSFIGCSKNSLTDDPFKNHSSKSDKSGKSFFDKVQWVQIKGKKEVILYMQKNKFEKINSYKAEKTLTSKNGEKIFNTIMDFDKYKKIFPRTLAYKKIKEISKNKYLVYSQINFSPYKNRDLYKIFEYSIDNKNNIKEWTVEWSSVDSYKEKLPDVKEFVRVKEIYARWKILEINDKVKISVEYHNDYNLPVSKGLSEPFEKNAIIDALNKVINSSI
jgi:hypothetical protein